MKWEWKNRRKIRKKWRRGKEKAEEGGRKCRRKKGESSLNTNMAGLPSIYSWELVAASEAHPKLGCLQVKGLLSLRTAAWVSLDMTLKATRTHGENA